MKKIIFFESQMDENSRSYQQKNLVPITRIIIICVVLLFGIVIYSFAGESKASSRSGLYRKAPTEKSSSSLSPETNSLYSPLRANPTTDPGAPGLDEGIGTATPVGEIPGVALFVIAATYLGFVFVRKQRELRVKN